MHGKIDGKEGIMREKLIEILWPFLPKHTAHILKSWDMCSLVDNIIISRITLEGLFFTIREN